MQVCQKKIAKKKDCNRLLNLEQFPRKTVTVLQNICDVLRDLVPFIQFNVKKHPWRSVTFSKVDSSMCVFHIISKGRSLHERLTFGNNELTENN